MSRKPSAFSRPARKPKPPEKPLTKLPENGLLYLDNHLLVFAKPAGLLTQGDATGDPDALSLAKDFIKERFQKPGAVFLGLVHRLDRPVSGVLVFARTSKAASRLGKQFRARSVTKRYLAVVEGKPAASETCVDYLWKDHRKVRVVKEGHPKGQRAELAWEMVYQQGNRSLLAIRLKTGRPHQIRVQLAHRGHPIIGDFRYGSSIQHDGRNLLLHSYLLEVDHPTREERMAWTAHPPSEWGDVWVDAAKRWIASAI